MLSNCFHFANINKNKKTVTAEHKDFSKTYVVFYCQLHPKIIPEFMCPDSLNIHNPLCAYKNHLGCVQLSSQKEEKVKCR